MCVSLCPACYYGGGTTGSGASQKKTLYAVKRQGTSKAYAICWEYTGPAITETEGTYMGVSILPVSSDFTPKATSDFSSLDWTDAIFRYFPQTGYRNVSNGNSANRGNRTLLWLSSTSTTNGSGRLNFDSTDLGIEGASGRGYAFSIRCVKN